MNLEQKPLEEKCIPQGEMSDGCGFSAGAAWYMLGYCHLYHKLGGGHFDQRQKETKVSHLVLRLEKLNRSSFVLDFPPLRKRLFSDGIRCFP